MEKLKQELHSLISQLSNRDIFYQHLRNLVSVYPFNEYEFMVASLFAQNILTYDSYIELRDEYISRNMFLYIFEISASRGFGEAWAQGHLKELAPQLEKPTKKKDPHYSGEYDFLLDRTIKIEVKASRAVDFESDEPLPLKALSSDSDRRFDMNFQQIKPRCCDVFIWVGVWRDRIRYRILNSEELEANRYYSTGQHRGNQGEGQLHLKKENITEFLQYEVPSNLIVPATRKAYQRKFSKSSSLESFLE